MKGFKKFWLVLYLMLTGLFFLAIVVFGAAQMSGVIRIPLVERLDYYFTLPSLLIAGGIGLIFAIYGLSLISTLKRRRGVPVVRKLTPEGDINITVDAIKTIANCVVSEFPSLTPDSTNVNVKDNNVDIAIRVFMNDVNRMSETAVAMQNRVKDVIEDNTGIVVNGVRVLINDVKSGKPLPKTTAVIPAEQSLTVQENPVPKVQEDLVQHE